MQAHGLEIHVMGNCFEIAGLTHPVLLTSQRNIQGGLKNAPELHLGRFQHTARILDEPVPDLLIYGHFPEAKV